MRTQIAAATQRWITEFVVRERLCPFAQTSALRIVVDEMDVSPQKRVMDFQDDCDRACMAKGLQRGRSSISELLLEHSPTTPLSNLFLVWPHGMDSLEVYLPFIHALVESAGINSGAGGWPEDPQKPAVAFPFHRTFDQLALSSRMHVSTV